jgi:hypothetical protein
MNPMRGVQLFSLAKTQPSGRVESKSKTDRANLYASLYEKRDSVSFHNRSAQSEVVNAKPTTEPKYR